MCIRDSPQPGKTAGRDGGAGRFGFLRLLQLFYGREAVGKGLAVIKIRGLGTGVRFRHALGGKFQAVQQQDVGGRGVADFQVQHLVGRCV